MNASSEVANFLQHHPDFDIESFDFLSRDAVDGLARSVGASNGVVQSLKSTQRLLRLGSDHAVASLLRQRGFDSAHSIAAVSEDLWVDTNQDAFPEGARQARDLHRRAQTVKGQATHLWAAVHGAVSSKTAQGIASHTADSRLVDFFSSLPDYEALFGPQDYCSCEHCRSVFGPAAYFVDLMRIIDRYVTQPNKIAANQTLESRRKDLFSLRLDCANTNTLVPTLQIVNTVLEERARTELGTSDVFKRLATQIYPLQLPGNVPLLEVRQYLASVNVSLADVFRAFERPRFGALVQSHTENTFTLELSGPPVNLAGAVLCVTDNSGAEQLRVVQSWDALTATGVVNRDWAAGSRFETCTVGLDTAFIAREALSLSTEQAFVVTNTDTSASYLKSAYGLGDAQPLSVLADAALFRQHTGMSRESLPEFLLQNLESDEIAAGMAHDLFINAPLADKHYVDVQTDDEGKQTVTNLNEKTLDRIHRFFRLSEWTGVAASDLDWALSSLGIHDIAADSLIALANAVQVRQSLGNAPWDIACAFWHDIKTTNSHVTGGPSGSLFDRVFNRPDQLRGTRPYHPLYAANPLYRDTPSSMAADGSETVSCGFGRMRLAAALGLSDEELTAVTALFFDSGDTVVLDVPTLTLFFRAATLMKFLRLTANGLKRLLAQHSMDARDPWPASRLELLLTSSRALSGAGLTPAVVDLIVRGDASGVPALQKPALPYNGVKTLWAQAMPTLITPASFAGDLLDIQESVQTYSLLASTRPELLLQMGPAYKTVMGLGPGRGIALVLMRVGVGELKFLSKLLDSEQIAAVARALNRTYDGQLSFLTEQLADLIGSSSQMLQAAVSFFDQVLHGRRPWLAQFFMPVGQNTKAWNELEKSAQVLRRLLFACEKLLLEPAEVQAITAMPEAFGLHDLAQPGAADIQALVDYKGLLLQLNCPVQEFLGYLALAPDPVNGERTKLLALSDLTGWAPEQITEVADRVGNGADLYNTVPGILRMSAAFSVLGSINADMRFAHDILVLQNLPVQDANEAAWNIWRRTASSVATLASTRFTEQAWPAVDAVAVSKLNEARRDMLEGVVLWKIRERFADIDSSARLYAFLLVDVKTGGCASTSLVVEGLSALQLYLQRCRLNLEAGVEKLAIPDAWWDWMMNYRVWEANRKIFLYPENYLVPSVRRNKTTVFKALEESLLQANVDDGAVARAYRDYLAGLEPITTLTFVDAYRCQRQDDEASGTQTLFLFARTRDEPYTYYHAAKTGEGVWTEWAKINVTIDSPHIAPVYAFGRLFLFWVHLRRVSTSEIRAPEGGTVAVSANSASYQATISYSFRDVDGDSWVATVWRFLMMQFGTSIKRRPTTSKSLQILLPPPVGTTCQTSTIWSVSTRGCIRACIS
ncbi:neuraminidase-like domain-containing protein [Acidovorax sp. sic0104]|uniref:neuraminidase-like domain-containing protein n=1 Tax=Acidovorax sp. sic0104 TaxID=2854784 RepID=UPI001C462157|nr:neuraminidase-like domain-containing protein [Acidovorax sp. sic0104]MBV7540829.1 hypothetical protein [Acidovorax sp. sic0104]